MDSGIEEGKNSNGRRSPNVGFVAGLPCQMSKLADISETLTPHLLFFHPQRRREQKILEIMSIFGAVSEVLEIEVNGAKQAHQNVAFLSHIFCSQKISGRKCDVNKTHTRLTRQRC